MKLFAFTKILLRAALALHLAVLSLASLRAQTASFQDGAFDTVRLMTGVTDEGEPRSIAVDREGNVLLTYSQMPRGTDYALLYASNVVAKVNLNGEVLWRYQKLPHTKAVTTDMDGAVYVAGTRIAPPIAALPSNYFQRAQIPTEGAGSGYVAKLSPDGAVEWVRLLGNTGKVLATAICVDDQKNYYVAGQYQESPVIGEPLPPVPAGNNWNVFLAKFAPDGRVLWVRAGLGSAPGNLIFVVVTSSALSINSDKTISICARSGPFFGGPPSAEVTGEFARFDAEGHLLMNTSIDNRFELGVSGADGSFFSAALERPPSELQLPATLRLQKLNSDGGLLWTREAVLKFANGNGLESLAVDREGNCFVAVRVGADGAEDSLTGEIRFDNRVVSTSTKNGYELVIAKYSPQGEVLSVARSEGLDGGADTSRVGPVVICTGPGSTVAVAGKVQGRVQFGDEIIDPPALPFYTPSPVFTAKVRFSSEPSAPSLNIAARQPNLIRISWSAEAASFVLESSSELPAPAWTPVTTAAVLEGSEYVVLTPTEGKQTFYRLRRM